MSKLVDLLEFYIKDAWKADEEGHLHPSPALLADKGQRAYAFKHSEPKWRMNKKATQAMYLIQMGELADCLRELSIVINMPMSELRTMKLGSLCARLQKIEYALRETEETTDAIGQH